LVTKILNDDEVEIAAVLAVGEPDVVVAAGVADAGG